MRRKVKFRVHVWWVLEKGITGRVTVTYSDCLCCCVVIGANICGASLV